MYLYVFDAPFAPFEPQHSSTDALTTPIITTEFLLVWSAPYSIICIIGVPIADRRMQNKGFTYRIRSGHVLQCDEASSFCIDCQSGSKGKSNIKSSDAVAESKSDVSVPVPDPACQDRPGCE
jgi:hypothetical protein